MTVATAVFLVGPFLLGGGVATVTSGSMAPAYPVGSLLAVLPVDPGDVKPGDVVTFASDASLVTHRVERVLDVAGAADELAFVTKGDANEDPDPVPVPASALRGRVVAGVPALGYLLAGLRQAAPLLVLGGLALMIRKPGSRLLRRRPRPQVVSP
jgi:signal peptidase